MAEIIKTWPAAMPAREVRAIFFDREQQFCEYYFTLGRGKPQQEITRLWYTYQGRIIGSFTVDRVVCNDGSFPALRRIDGEEGGWRIRPDYWVAICHGPMLRPRQRMYMSGFRGWRYFDLAAWLTQPESGMRL